MSHIATALAKSKGKNVSAPAPAGASAGLSSIRIGPQSTPVLTRPPFTPASASPFPPAAAAPAPEMPVSKPMPVAAPKRSTLIVVISAILLVAGISAWLLLKKDTSFAQLTRRKPTAVSNPTAAPAKIAPIESTPERRPPSDELAEKVRTLPITAVAGGTSQRLSMGGKVYEPGQTVAEGLILQAIETEEIVFRDVDGNIYTRRL